MRPPLEIEEDLAHVREQVALLGDERTMIANRLYEIHCAESDWWARERALTAELNTVPRPLLVVPDEPVKPASIVQVILETPGKFSTHDLQVNDRMKGRAPAAIGQTLFRLVNEGRVRRAGDAVVAGRKRRLYEVKP
jgi:hypothetical protein